jgi:hypothetical protein
METKKTLYIFAIIIGMLILANGITNPTDGENLRVMAALGLMGWATIIYKVETKTE